MTKKLKLKWLLLGEFFGSFGNSFIWPLTTIYMHNQLHQSLTISGVILLLYSTANVISSTIAGPLFDHHNSRHLMSGGLLAAIAIMLVLVFDSRWPIYPIGLIAFGFFNGWIITILNAFGTQVTGHQSRFTFNMLYLTNNLGVVLGTMVAGPLYQLAGDQVSPLFIITIFMYCAYLSVIILAFPRHTRVTSSKTETGSSSELPSANQIIIGSLFTAIAVVWVTYTQWSSNLAVFVTDHGFSMSQYSLLWTINGALIVVFQAIINWLGTRIHSDYCLICFGIAACAISFIFLLTANTYFDFILGMTTLTLGEATAFPTIPALVNKLSPTAVKGKYQGLLNAFVSVGKAIGPLLGGITIDHYSYHILFGACFLILILLTIFVGGIGLVKHQQAQIFGR